MDEEQYRVGRGRKLLSRRHGRRPVRRVTTGCTRGGAMRLGCANPYEPAFAIALHARGYGAVFRYRFPPTCIGVSPVVLRLGGSHPPDSPR